MALLHWCLPSPVVLPLHLHVTGTRTVQSQLSQCRPSLACCASSKGKDPAVFMDDSNGIVCTSGADGEIVCEGWDEGPHFQPVPGKGYTMRKKVGAGPRKARGGEGEGFKSTGAKLQESIREGTAEISFNSSEL